VQSLGRTAGGQRTYVSMADTDYITTANYFSGQVSHRHWMAVDLACFYLPSVTLSSTDSTNKSQKFKIGTTITLRL